MSDPLNRELDPTLLGVSALDPYVGTTSSARGAMFVNHAGQAPILEGNESRLVITGSEIRYAEHTFDIRLPEDVQILHILRKYPTGVGHDSIRMNPVTTIIYEHYNDPYKTIGVLQVPEFISMHQDFGYRLQRNRAAWEQMHVGALIAKDTVLANSTAVKANGLYGMGVNLNAVFMAVPGTIEDGFIINEDCLDKISMRTYTQVVGNAGRKSFFLNMYGDDKTFKPFPDVGERIRADGVIFALRDHDDDLTPAEMTPRALRTLDRTFDRAAIGEPGAFIIDVDVFRDNRVNPSYTPTGMDGQLMKYYGAMHMYYKEIIRIAEQLKRSRKEHFRFTPEFNMLLIEAQIHMPVNEGRKLTRMYRLDPLDEWRVNITYESIKRPSNAYKLTDFFGGKGVICKVMKNEDMPIDKWGNRADVIIYGGSTIRRANYGRLYEHGFGAAARDLMQRLKIEAGFDRHHFFSNPELDVLMRNTQFVDYAFKELMDFYAIVTPTQREMLVDDPDRARYVRSIFQESKHYLYSPVDDKVDLMAAVNGMLNSRFRPNYGPVTYRDQGGTVVETVNNVLVGPLYIMGLEKIGEDWSAVSSVEVQQFGLPSKLNKNDRATTPGRESAIRSYGESETRSYIATCGPEPTVELLDQTNSPDSHQAVVEAYLTAPYPSRIARAVDRKKVPFGGSRPVGLLDHLLECRGLKFVYAFSN
jgi:DNA-directed RNA polymerase beta subunit